MVSSLQNNKETSGRPTVVYWQVAMGWHDSKGNDHLTRIEVITSKRRAFTFVNSLERSEAPTKKDQRRSKYTFARLYEVTSKMRYAVLPDLTTTFIGERRF